MRTVTAKMQRVRRISANIGAGSQLALDLGIKITADTSPKYTGEYDVRPKTYEPVVLETKGRSMLDDVTVQKIPQFEVSNDAGGKTLILGAEYYG